MLQLTNQLAAAIGALAGTVATVFFIGAATAAAVICLRASLTWNSREH